MSMPPSASHFCLPLVSLSCRWYCGRGPRRTKVSPCRNSRRVWVVCVFVVSKQERSVWVPYARHRTPSTTHPHYPSCGISYDWCDWYCHDRIHIRIHHIHILLRLLRLLCNFQIESVFVFVFVFEVVSYSFFFFRLLHNIAIAFALICILLRLLRLLLCTIWIESIVAVFLFVVVVVFRDHILTSVSAHLLPFTNRNFVRNLKFCRY